MIVVIRNIRSTLTKCFMKALLVSTYIYMEIYPESCSDCFSLTKPEMSRVMRKPVLRVSNQVQHKRAVQPQKMAGDLKFCILEVEGLYYLCSENKGADQLGGYGSADLPFCFLIFVKQVFS